MSFVRWLVLGTIASTMAFAEALPPGAEVTLEGTVTDVVSHDAFWFEGRGVRVLVYHHVLLPGELHDGQRLRVHGRVSDDWMRLADTEINAQRIEAVGDFAATP